jgi:Ala-tRNA(Pro) deacylase
MRLNETLKNCLLALSSRHPGNLVDFNQDMPVQPGFLGETWPPACSPVVMVELLQRYAPQMLTAPACLVLDGPENAIYLLEQSQERPMFRVHYGRGSALLCHEHLKAYLCEHRVPFQQQQHPRAFSARELAASEHLPDKMVAKTVIVLADHQMLWLILQASYRVDLDRVHTALEAHEVRLAHEAELAKAFPDCPVGALPPFGNLYGVPVYVEKSLAEEEVIVFPAGSYTETMRYADFERLAHSKVLAFARKPALA